MNNFDKNQLKLLEPLLRNEIVLHYSFFANTYPIAYHYFQIVHEKNSKKGESVIRHHDWNYPIPPEILPTIGRLPIHAFYAAKRTEKIIEDICTKPYGSQSLKYSKIRFSKYVPRFIFLKYSVLWRKYFEEDGNFDYDFDEQNEIEALGRIPELTEKIVEYINNNDYDKIEIYTDTPGEAKCIIEVFKKLKLEVEPTVLDDRNDVIMSKTDKSSNILEIHFYSAPVSMYLINQKDQYIPFRLREQDLNIPENFEAFLYVLYSLGSEISKSELLSIVENIERYHKNLFDVARNNPVSLINVFYSYNRISKLSKQFSQFKNFNSYAKCLSLYHDYEDRGDKKILTNIDSGNDVERKKPSNCEKMHIHLGAGRLGIGLVLPTFKPDNDYSTTKTLILQKQRPYWKQLKKNGRYIKLKTTQDFELDLKFVYDIDHDNPLDEIISRWRGGDIFLLYKGSLSYYKKLFEVADIISISVDNQSFQNEIGSLLSTTNFSEKEVVYIFPFENKISDNLLSINSSPPLRLIETKADRICFIRDEKIKKDGDYQIVKVKCEEYGEIVLNTCDADIVDFFHFNSRNKPHLIFTGSDSIFNFYSNRKKYLLNELHFAIALYGYHYLASKKITEEKWTEHAVPIILDAIHNDMNYKPYIESFTDYQIIRLILNTDKKTLLSISPEYNDTEKVYFDLLQYSKFVIKRFANSEDDPIKRILDFSKIDKLKAKRKDIIENFRRFINTKKNRILQLEIGIKPYLGDLNETISDLENKFAEVLIANRR